MDVVAELPGLRPVRRFLPKNKMVAARLPEAPIAGLAEPVPDAAAAIVPDSAAATVAKPTAVSASPAVPAADAAPAAALQRHSPEPAPVQAPLAAVVAGNALAARGPALITPGASMAWKPPPPAGSAAATPAVAADGAEGDSAPARKARLIDFCTAFRNKRQKRLPGAVKAVVVKAEETPAAAAAARAAAAREAAFAPASARFVGAAVPGFANSLQVQFVDGKMVLIESTMEIGDQRPQETVDWEEIEESGEPTATACSFAPKRARSERWSAEDTRKFFRCLQRCGTDFSLMEEQFQFTRSRRQLKNKFNSEERRNPALISKALLAALPMDMTDFEERQRKAEADAAAKKRPRRDRLNTMQSTAATEAGGDGGNEGGGGGGSGSGGDAEGASAEGAAAAAAAEEERMRVDAEKEEEELMRDPLARPRSSAGAAPAAAEAPAPAAAAAAAAAAAPPPEAPRATAEVAAAEALVAVGSARQAVPAAAADEGESVDGVHEEDAARERMRTAADPLMFPDGAAAAAASKPVPRHRPKPKSCKA